MVNAPLCTVSHSLSSKILYGAWALPLWQYVPGRFGIWEGARHISQSTGLCIRIALSRYMNISIKAINYSPVQFRMFCVNYPNNKNNNLLKWLILVIQIHFTKQYLITIMEGLNFFPPRNFALFSATQNLTIINCTK